jgi:hypothetical protein
MSESRYLRLIDCLIAHDVRFVIVGGMAAVLQRAPILTEDLDLVHDRSPENVNRLLAALQDLDAVYRNDRRKLRPGPSHLTGAGSQLLESGPLRFDVIGELTPGGGYDDLIASTDAIDVGGRVVRVLTLEKLIEIKRALPRPKDKLMLIHLEATLEEREKLKPGGE